MLLTRKEQAGEESREMESVTFPSLSMDTTLIRVGGWHPPPSGEGSKTIWKSRAQQKPLVRYLRRLSAVWNWKRRAGRVVDDGWDGKQNSACSARLSPVIKTGAM